MAFIDYVGVGAGVSIIVMLVVLGIKEACKRRPPIDWEEVGFQFKQAVGSIILILICFTLAAICVAVGACTLAGVGWVFVQLLKLVGLLP